MPSRIARVMVESTVPALDRLFDYAIPDSLHEEIAVGCRVRIPLRSGGRLSNGFVVELTDSSDFAGELSTIDSVVSSVPVLAPEVWRVARRAADRAAGTASDIVRLAVPKRQVRVERAWSSTPSSDISAPQPRLLSGYAPAEDPSALGQRTAIAAVPDLVPLAGGDSVPHWAVTVAELSSRVTARGEKIIVCLPDYRDVNLFVRTLTDFVPDALISRVDAAQTSADRYRNFLDCLHPGPRVIVGNRSAVYAPADELGMIVVWDDDDGLYREPLAPYVHTRDAALIRQDDSGCALAFLSHSRSVECQRLVELSWLTELSPSPMVRPRVVLHDAGQTGDRARIPSAAWEAARRALEYGPVLVQVARPGYAPAVACRRCGEGARCSVCSGPLGVQTPHDAPQCALCGSVAASWSCRSCGNDTLRLVSRGTGRTTEELGRAFPGIRVVTSDGDHHVETVPQHPALVVATRGAEPLAAGGYAAVLLLDGERMLARERLSIAVDCLRWWSNAAALSAPGATTHLIGVSGDLARALATWTQAGFAASELADRRSLLFPPAIRTVALIGQAPSVTAAIESVDTQSYRDVLGPTETEEGNVRAVIRFDYSAGADVAAALKAALIRDSARRRRAPAAKGGYRSAMSLRIRFDETEILE